MADSKNDPRRIGTIWTLIQEEQTPEIQPLVQAVFIRLEPGAVSALADPAGLDSNEILRRLDSGSRCYTAWVKGQIAAYGWVSFCEENVGELKLRLHMQQCEAYIWDCATIPTFRQMRLYSALLVHIVRQLQAESVCRIWIGANVDNAPSQRGIDRAGFHRVADLAITKTPGKRLIKVLGYPGVSESLVADARRVFLNNRDQTWIGPLQEVTK